MNDPTGARDATEKSRRRQDSRAVDRQMIAGNGWRQQERLDASSRLESLVLRETDPNAWNATALAEADELAKRWADLGDSDGSGLTPILVGMYRLNCRARVFRAPKEYFFWLLVGWLHMEAHVGPDALLHQKEYLGPLWKRLEAIYDRHGWPREEDDGDPWNPGDHLKRIPKDYSAWAEEFERVVDEMEGAAFRAVCEKYGLPEIADLREQDPEEYEGRLEAGCAHGAQFRPREARSD